jgi:signal transduction histidine kinase
VDEQRSAALLNEFIHLNREEIIARCQAKVAARSMPPPTESEINHGVPVFLDQLVDVLRSGVAGASADIDRSAAQHGRDLLLQGLSVSQVVHDYGDICQTITELAIETNAPISTDDFRTLNRCLDEAIASAVTMYSRESHRAQADKAVDRENERLGFLVHELRNLVNTALVAFEVLKSGNVGVGGSTGAVLDRSLSDLRELISRSLDEVRLTKAVNNRNPVLVAGFIEDVAATALLEAKVRGILLTLPVSVPEDLTINVDRQVLAAVLGNLLQNAFKFTRPGTMVTLRVSATAARVLLEVQDECGGLPGVGAAGEVPASFEQRGADRSGLGIGLAFSRWGAEANAGRLYARSMPGKGCVFTVDLPRASVPGAVLA